ncbi:unnamed protein product [Pleuronectes platessa]|uniref:Uncharacterized protein n=1 Tax=Pleuronectes platessa TaxID=8262 RepID=A0A9N7VR72_PLEPL|nr:unnamed protein product [Pleuronectes platessa]
MPFAMRAGLETCSCHNTGHRHVAVSVHLSRSGGFYRAGLHLFVIYSVIRHLTHTLQCHRSPVRRGIDTAHFPRRSRSLRAATNSTAPPSYLQILTPERREGVSGKQSGGYKDTGLPSLIHQPIGLDRIHQLPRIRRLPLTLLFPLSLYLSLNPPLPPHLLSHYPLLHLHLHLPPSLTLI